MTTKSKPTPPQWLLMIHQLPAKPAYVRVKIGRKLRSLGAVSIKNAVHALPLSAEAAQAYTELSAEIIQGGGEVVVCEARLVGGLSDIEARALFDAARDADYEELAQEGRTLLEAGQVTQAESRRLRKRREEIVGIDFFAAHGRQTADDVIAEVERLLYRHPDVSRTDAPPKLTRAELKGRVWVTRRHIHVDRIASAWLIRRFIDPAAIFKFVDGKNYKPQSQELRFDMANAEFTHEDNDCTFETLVRRAELSADPALRAIAEIIHDLDVEEEKFGRPEAAGLGALIAGTCATTSSDDDRLTLGAAALDQFYAYFGKR